jgi:hypothetical protein
LPKVKTFGKIPWYRAVIKVVFIGAIHMRFRVWFGRLLLIAVSTVLLCRSASGGQDPINKDDLCFIQTTSGQKVKLDKLCGKSGDRAVSDVMWDENNHDPAYVSKNSSGIWQVKLGGPHPFKYSSGAIIWPDGRITSSLGETTRLVNNPDGSIRGVQYYREDKLTPLKSGETMTLQSGLKITQEPL